MKEMADGKQRVAAYPREGISAPPTAFEDLIGAFWRLKVLALPLVISFIATYAILLSICWRHFGPWLIVVLIGLYCSPISIGWYMATSFVMRHMAKVLGPTAPSSVFGMTVIGVLPVANVVLFVRLYLKVVERLRALGIRPFLLWIREMDKDKVRQRLAQEAAVGVDMSVPPKVL